MCSCQPEISFKLWIIDHLSANIDLNLPTSQKQKLLFDLELNNPFSITPLIAVGYLMSVKQVRTTH